MEVKKLSENFLEAVKMAKKPKEKDVNPQVGEDRVEIEKNDTGVKPLTISMKFAVDKNNNNKVDDGEIIKSLSELSDKDTDGDKKLKGKELKGVFFEYGKDDWMEGGKVNYKPMESGHARVQLKEVNIETGAIDMNINVSF